MITLFVIVLLISLFSENTSSSSNNSSTNNKTDKLEKEIKKYELDSFEADLVRKREYDPWDFDEEDEDFDDF